jgi:predicted  nucleic acid-binding Zn-ribbon protein
MTENTRISLRELQRLDTDIREAREQVAGFAPLLEEVEEPAAALESEVESTRKRLREIRLEERRLELSADEKRARSKRLQDRLNTVRNLREEAAVHAELDLVRRALEGDEQEALGLLDQIRKLEERLEELEAELGAAQAEVEPRRDELLAQQAAAGTRLEELIAQRDAFAEQIDSGERRLYESIKAGGRTVVVAELTVDGACGHCFSMIPLQVQANVRSGADVIRCEACGVILAAAVGGVDA